ncbi:DNA polymerase Y family protein [Isoptericola chiayiensis]|uniref:DNA polymerase Y family protein n=1 Tax=Isoptericola chiayiensis TaxID=579446 RepID=A0ABP8YEH7_9MICO|nr:DNA polymerase Y family protein [Isoptericola chiayiensis]NOV99791.1 protein ImuB [Isoptericola chiayiensis]
MSTSSPHAVTTRTAVLWVPDWPVVAALTAADLDAHVPAAVLGAPSGGGTTAGRSVVATSAVARTAGVRRGMRRRQAQEACPDLVLLEVHDERDARAFEPVAAAAETVVAGLEIARPGLLLLPADGAARYHGSERALAEALVAAVAEAGHECQVGVADGLLAAVLAARSDAVVPPGGSPAALAGRPVGELVHAVCDPGVVAAVRDAVGLWRRLGLHTLGDLAALPAASVSARFGDLGTWAHRLARGEDERPPARRRPEADLAVGTDLDPPADRVDAAAFAARRLAEELHALLVTHGAACGRLRITARTTEGELERLWRTDTAAGGLSAARITDRVRWQLEGWLTDAARRRTGPASGPGAAPEVAPVVHLALAAEDVAPAGTHQPSLWGADAGQDERARQALDRVQGLLGGDAVLTVRRAGGRHPRHRVRLVPYGEEAVVDRSPDRPWPGALPSPAPATVLPEPAPVRLLDAAGADVVVDARLAMSGRPALVRRHRDTGSSTGSPLHGCDDPVSRRPGGISGEERIVGWAGPWPLAERWWAPDGGTRRVHLQAVLEDGRGLLLAQVAGAWQMEALYD